MLAEVAWQREQARTVSKLEYSIQMELIARFLGKLQLAVADQK